MAEILQYVPGNGIFHQLHPVTKILLIIIVSAVTILTSSIAVLAGILLLIFLLALAGHLLRPVIQQMVLVLAMSIVIFLITIPIADKVAIPLMGIACAAFACAFLAFPLAWDTNSKWWKGEPFSHAHLCRQFPLHPEERR